jgi:hypothetical protein
VYGTCSLDIETLSCVPPLEKEHSTYIEVLLQLGARVYLLVLVWLFGKLLSKVKGAWGWLRAYGWVENIVIFSMVK